MWKGEKNYCTTSSFPTHVIEIYLSANKERALAVSSQCLEEPLNMCCWQKNRIVITQPSVFLAVKQKEPCDFLKTSLMWLWKKRTLCRTMTDTGISSILFSLPCSASRFCLVLSFFFFSSYVPNKGERLGWDDLCTKQETLWFRSMSYHKRQGSGGCVARRRDCVSTAGQNISLQVNF